MPIQNIAIVGMGALGILYGQHLEKHKNGENIFFIANRERIVRFEKEGVFCNDKLCNFKMINEEISEIKADLLIMAVKGTALDKAIISAKNFIGDDTIILSVLNGISSEKILGDAFGNNKIIPCIVQGMDASRIDNRLVFSNFGKIFVGIEKNALDKRKKLQTLLDLFNKVNLPYVIEDDIHRRIWSKFMLNVGVNQTTMVFESTYGSVQVDGEPRRMMIAAMKEVIELAVAEGINLSTKDLDDYLNLIAKLDPEGMTSMRQDGYAKKISEVDLFSGTVLQLAKKHGLALPVNTYLYETIKAMEATY